MTQDFNAPLHFIQPHVLDRLVQGVFVAKRSKGKNYKLQDRRDMLSPLNVTRRAVRYEPLVFTNRRDLMLSTANALNNPETKLFLISGPAGRGKTSFVRGLVEMMGGGKEQLLWFDVSRHTDFDEVVRFLVEYMTYICRMDGQPEEEAPREDTNPVATLEALLRRATDYPILLVIDNMEFLVAPDQSIRSRELKEAFNFLLSFPNIKLILAGKVLPFSDMNPAANAIQHIQLEPLTEEKSLETVREMSAPLCQLPPEQLNALVSWMGGEPYRLFLLASLFEHFAQPEVWLAEREISPENPDSVLMRFAWQPLSFTEKMLLGILAMLRHSAPPRALQALFRICEPSLKDVDFQALMQHGLRRMLKKVYPPQLVLDKLRNRTAENAGQMVIEPYYQMAELFQEYILQTLTEEKLAEYHERLHQFYRQEKDKHLLDRLYPTRTAHLAAESQYHLSRMKKRRTMITRPEGTVELQHAERKESTLMSPPPSHPMDEPMPDFRVPAAESLPWPTYPEETLPPMDPVPMIEPYPHGLSYPIAMPMPVPMSQEVRLSPEDLEKLADLITKRNYLPKPTPVVEFTGTAMPLPSAPEPAVAPESVSAPVTPTEQWFKDLAASSDAEEQEHQQRLAEAMADGNIPEIALALYQLGDFRLKRGLYQNAEGCWLKALEYAEEAHYQPLVLRLHAELGHYYNAHYKHNQAIKHLRAVTHAYESGQWNDMPGELLVKCYRDMAEIHFYRQAYQEAHQVFEKCLTMPVQDPAVKGDILFRLGLIADELGNRPMAMRRYQQAYEAASSARANEICAAVLYNQGSLYYEVGRWDDADKTLTRCLVYDKQNGTTSDVFRTQMLLSKVNEARKQRKFAESFAMEALHTAEHLASIPAQVSALIRLGHLAEQDERSTQALGFYKKAQALAGESLSEESRSFLKRKRQALEGKASS